MAVKVYNLRSCETDNGIAKAPSANLISYGEVAINYASGCETLFVKNSDDEIVGIRLDGSVQATAEILALHEARNDNPHGVTKEQVGLGNVDDTCDLDKPVSEAQQEALDRKLDKESGVVDNLHTNRSDVALSAAQGMTLYNMARDAAGAAFVDLTELNNRISALEEEVDDIVAQATTIASTCSDVATEFAE